MTVQSKGNEPQIIVEGDSFTYDSKLMEEGKFYDFACKGRKMSLRKLGKTVWWFHK